MKTERERFEAKFVKGDGCWEWVASKDRWGYGRLKIFDKMQGAHRAAYQLYVGEIPDGLCVLHRCDNPACVRPDHLFLGTHTDNMHDCNDKGRRNRPSGEKHYRTKITARQVLIIRAMRAAGARGVDLARKFGVTPGVVDKIIHYRTWAKL